MLEVIDGRVVNFNTKEPLFRRSHLEANDITTVVSAAILVLRIITGAWTSQSAWRCALILLEIQGITLEQFNRMISWPVYFLKGSTDAYIATLILLLLVPANLVAPVITGSVGWKEVMMEVTAVPFQHTGPATTNRDWYYYSLRTGTALGDLAISAISRAGVGWIELGHKNSSRLVTASQQQITLVNSVIDNLTLPFLEIHNISWDKRPTPNSALSNEFSYGSEKSRLTLTGERPFNSYSGGNAVLFDEQFLSNYPSPETNNNSDQARLPLPTVFRGTKRIAIMVLPWAYSNCSPLGDTIFGNKAMARLKGRDLDGFSVDGNCFFIGTVNFTAGVIRKRAKFITSRVLEAEAGPSTSIEGDTWVIESLYLLPDVMMRVSRLNVSQFPTWDNLDGYVGDLIRISYQAAWGQLAHKFDTSPLNLTAYGPVRGLQAVVSQPRVIGWYCAQFLVLVSAALLWMLQKRSNRPVTIDTGVVALLVDPAPILNKYDETQDLSRMSYVMESDCGMIQLAERDVPGGREQVSLVRHGDSSAEAAEPPKRFMLVPREREAANSFLSFLFC